ncbi:hypothetical protein [Belnapia moabensis]|uniref:hypothetical protein n=1 Tax=Belnapia moabensis TaxID=365533 RepID=UPI0005BDCB1E|nr:hypothetical protein [Belnapia moabensis]
MPKQAREIMLQALVSCVHGYTPENTEAASDAELEFTDGTLHELEKQGWTLAPVSDRQESAEAMVKALIIALYGDAPEDLGNPDYSDAVSLGKDILAKLANHGWTPVRIRSSKS